MRRGREARRVPFSEGPVFCMRVYSEYITYPAANSFTYDHRTMRIRLPVRSAIYKHCTGALVLGWVTTGEYALLYVFALFDMMIFF